jgi:hypothetical protein
MCRTRHPVQASLCQSSPPSYLLGAGAGDAVGAEGGAAAHAVLADQAAAAAEDIGDLHALALAAAEGGAALVAAAGLVGLSWGAGQETETSSHYEDTSDTLKCRLEQRTGGQEMVKLLRGSVMFKVLSRCNSRSCPARASQGRAR